MPHDIARRSFLARISAAPAAIAAVTLPLPVLAYPGPVADAIGSTDGVDADVIAQAATVARLSRLHDRASARAGRKGDAVMLAMSPRPVAPEWDGSCTVDDLPVEAGSGVERRFITNMIPSSDAYREAKRRHDEAMAAWRAEEKRREHEVGVADADALSEALGDRVADATAALVVMPATSPAGLAAKAGVFLALTETRDLAEQWVADLGSSVARDAARIGVAARAG